MEEELIRLLEQSGLIEDNRVMLQSFSEESLKKLNQLVPEVRLTQLYRSEEFDLKKALASPYSAIGIESGDMLEEDVKALQLVEKEVHVYFTDYKTEQEEQQRVVKYGIDGLFTDQIQFTRSLVDENKLEVGQ
ncbi:glycerophosphodiester phosphodiesterase family protein [Bacillus sp. JCM 19041]|uniref:glycerophosphodiester phosphodiesterase family protein n=1 Tax=Bacillus sp. JCM 19041 TaxID=1460637 RepID=UPI0006CFB9C6